jgi:hypothetical protein
MAAADRIVLSFERQSSREGETMNTEMGVWIDHRQAVIVGLSKTGATVTRIRSDGEKQLRRSGEPSIGSFETQQVPADDSREREYTGHLARYYDDIISHLRPARSILIFGPGEAKGELKKRVEKDKGDARIVAVETVDKMTEPQIVEKVRHCFHHDAERQGARRRKNPDNRNTAKSAARGSVATLLGLTLLIGWFTAVPRLARAPISPPAGNVEASPLIETAGPIIYLDYGRGDSPAIRWLPSCISHPLSRWSPSPSFSILMLSKRNATGQPACAPTSPTTLPKPT